jgi:uncharacterized protein YcbX
MPITIAALNVYPVKGLKGIALEHAACTDRGLEHDRRWMVVDPQGQFLTQRSHPRMATVWTDLLPGALALSAPDMPELLVPLRPADGPRMRVQVWRSTCDALPASREADAWLTEYLGVPCRLVYMPDDSQRPSNPEYAGPGKLVGFADGYAYLVVGEESLADLNRRLAARGQVALPMNRFRPNIVVRGAQPYAEDTWRDVRMGSAALRGVKPCGRCEVTTTDQSTGEARGPEPLATLAEYRSSDAFGVMFGMNFVTVGEGRIAVGDAVEPR